MAIEGFRAAAETGLDAIQGDFLAKDETLDDDAAAKENNYLLTLAYVLVKALRARQRSSNDRNRVFGTYVGGHAAKAFQQLVTMIEPVYQEFRAAADDVDDDSDDPWEDDYLTRGTGCKGGPTH